MIHSHLKARLFLNDVDVGAVKVRGWDGSWGFGEFTPGDAFTAYAHAFGRWSLLIHADDSINDNDSGRLSRAASQELRAAEYEIDRIRARLFLVGPREWRPITQLNIDGPLIEWKEDFPSHATRSGP